MREEVQWIPASFGGGDIFHSHIAHSVSVPNLPALEDMPLLEDHDDQLHLLFMSSKDHLAVLRMLVSQLRAAHAEQQRLKHALHIAKLEADTYKQVMIKCGLGRGTLNGRQQ